MMLKTTVILILPIFLLASIAINPVAHAAEERKVLSRDYVGLGLDVFASYQCYPGEDIAVRVRVEALENVKNASVTLFIWGSKSEGSTPWGTSFTVLDVTDFPTGTVEEEVYNITMPSDIDPGLTYGILFLDWNIYGSTSWEAQWDKASFRATYVKNKIYEDLNIMYGSATNDMQNIRILMYIFFATTIIPVALAVHFARKKAG